MNNQKSSFGGEGQLWNIQSKSFNLELWLASNKSAKNSLCSWAQRVCLLFVQGKWKAPMKSQWRCLMNLAASKLSLLQSNPNDRPITHNLTACDMTVSAQERLRKGNTCITQWHKPLRVKVVEQSACWWWSHFCLGIEEICVLRYLLLSFLKIDFELVFKAEGIVLPWYVVWVAWILAVSACSRSRTQEYLRKGVCYQNQVKQGHRCNRKKGETALTNSRMIMKKTITQ